VVLRALLLSRRWAEDLEEDQDNKVGLVAEARRDFPRVRVHQCCPQVEEVMTAGIRIGSG